ncbi:MAG TPA: serine hydroxymethyltransferase [Candidatus Paceibacterota bacterium]
MKDTQIQKIIEQEQQRQYDMVNLIASENVVSDDVMEAVGSVLGNKYAEGYSGARYYAGNQYIDELEELCKERALAAFGLSDDKWAVNVQPYSGSPANMAVYHALIPVGSKIMGLQLDQGGHLTHGYKASITGKLWQQVPYILNKETELLDYDAMMALAQTEQPALIVAGYTAYSRTIDWKRMRDIADSVGAYLHADISHIAGLVATGAISSPFEYADTVMTTTHKTLRGPRGAMIFSKKDTRNLPQKIDKTVFPGMQGGPHMNQIAGVAVALAEAQTPEYKKYIQQVIKNAQAMAQKFEELGWRVVSGGTDTHLFILDTWMNGKGISGKAASDALEKEGIIVNMNTIPYDTRSPMDPSGIRIGTPFVTTQGLDEKCVCEVAEKIDEILKRTM